MTYYITGLDAADALALARRIWKIVEPAVDRAPTRIRYSYQGFLQEVAQRLTQVWLVIDLDDDEIAAVLTTCIADDTRFPGIKLLEIPLVAGRDFRGWIGNALALLNAWGMAHQCDIMVAYSRRGWERAAGFIYHSENEDGIRVMIRPIGGYH
jgi:hypothetical protein